MEIRIMDCETDGLLDTITKVHCLCYWNGEKIVTLTDYQDIRDAFEEEDILWAGHNITRFDIPALKKIVRVREPEILLDTLAISWYLYPEEEKHGLEEWGERLGIQKPEVKDWSSDNIERILYRCGEDIKINIKLWNKFKNILEIMYTQEKMMNLIKYLHFKLDCVKEQEEIGIRLDIDKCKETLTIWETEKDEKAKELENVMPKVPIYKVKEYPRVITRKDGSFSKQGELWFDLLKDEGLPIEETKVIKTVVGYNEPNVNSHEQVKSWLYSLGWVPEHIKHKRDKKKGIVKQIPQVGAKLGKGEICDSVKKLYDKEPKLSILEGLTVVSHRISVLKAFLEDQVEGRLYPSMAGLTNTLRLKHKVVVNLPALDKKYGKEIRELLIADKGSELCGSDLSNIEDRTKRHYIYKYDPKYVEDMNIPGYDAHLEMGVLAGFITKEDVEFYKDYEKRRDFEGEAFNPSKEDKNRFGKLKGIRNKAKITNFSATYKIGAEALARDANIKLSEARKLLKIYWQRNKAILLVEKECKVMEAGGKRWLLNPISGFWYSLRSDKDKFSTLNQGTAVYVFDIWLREVRRQGIRVALQYHDEILFNNLLGFREETKKEIEEAMEIVNDKLRLNVPVGCSVQWGDSYSTVH